MPRTRQVKREVEPVVDIDELIEQKKEQAFKDLYEIILKNKKEALEQYEEKLLNQVNMAITCFKSSVPESEQNMTLGELRRLESMRQTHLEESKSKLANRTHTQPSASHMRSRLRSSSCSNDAGYITGESSHDSTTQKKKTTTKPNRKNRSVSRDALKTPLNQKSNMMTFGMVTPKMKPNTPQVLLRRPKQGEVAISMEGSPLLVSNVVSDSTANVNIPLANGAILSIQPERGLRISQLPDFDDNTRLQLKKLRDNLNEVCAKYAK